MEPPGTDRNRDLRSAFGGREKRCRRGWNKRSQGLKPDFFWAVFGTTKVVPFYKAGDLVFQGLLLFSGAHRPSALSAYTA